MVNLQYWNNGEPIIEDDSASMKELKYWLNGEPYVVYEKGSSPTSYRRRVIIS